MTDLLAYWDSTAEQDGPDGDREHRDELLESLLLEAVDRDRDLIELVIRAGVERGRGAAMAVVCERHRQQADAVQRADEDDSDG